MKPVKISDGIYWLGVNDDQTELFEGLWSIKKEGISYNSYLIHDEKSAVIDLCKDIFSEEYIAALKSLIDPASINYLVVNHMEPDHSGALRAFRELAPQAVILTTKKSVPMLADFFGISEGIQVVQDGETLNLGNHTLKFVTAPMVHWPETMVTYEIQSQTLFSCDAFGGYGKLTNGIFDDDYEDKTFFDGESLRYFANIVAAFSKPVLNAVSKLEGVPVKVVAPSHGLVWRTHPERIIELYTRWSQYSKGEAESCVCILHGSMYGNTTEALPAIEKGLNNAGVDFVSHDVTSTHISYILPDLWRCQGVIVGAPTYEGTIFPTMAAVLQMAEYKRIYGKTAAFFGSYGWGGGAMRYMTAQADKLKWDLINSFEFAGSADSEDLITLSKMAEKFGILIAS